MNTLYTTEEVAKMLSLSKMSVYRYIKAGKLSAYKVGRDFRISQKALQQFLNQSSIVASPKP